MKDYYAILEVRPDAGSREIRAAWRRQAFLCHPDRNAGREHAAHVRFLDLAEAWAVLGDPAARRDYDARSGVAGGPARPAAAPPRPGGRGPAARRPDPAEEEMPGRGHRREADRAVARDFLSLMDTVAHAAPAGDEVQDPLDPREPARRFDESGKDYVRRLRRWRADVRRLAAELALRDRFGQLVDGALLLLAVLALGAVPAGWLIENYRAGVAGRPPPGFWLPPVTIFAGVVALAWFAALREGRIRRFRGYAAEVLRRREQRGETGVVVRGP